MTQDSIRAANYVGYATVEEWTKSANPGEPVYCMLITEPGKATTHGMRVDNLVIAVAQTDARGDVHYVRLPVGALTYLLTADGKKPWNSDHAERKERAEQAHRIVVEWLTERCAVREATIAMPTGFRLLDGWANFLGWDKDTQKFYRQDEVK